ncbi:MAG: ABC transporter substrate-binding protein [Chitinophagales bacterium]|nr:ABC transporter substrate-binding protein [Chitinophagales bacterium]
MPQFFNYRIEFLLLLLLTASNFSFAQNTLVKDSLESDKTFSIVFLLPFNSQKVFIIDLSTSEFNFPDESKLSIEIYEGALFALDSLKKMGFNAIVNSYDVGNDSASIQNILTKKEVKDADLIIGPINGVSLKQAASFALREHIPLISPLSATYFPNDPNQFLILANATMQTHCEFIYDYLLDHELVHRMIMVYRKNNQDLELVKFIKDYRDKKTEQGSPEINFVELTDSSETTFRKLKDSLYFTDKNIILIPSSDEVFVRSMMKRITNLDSAYHIQVYGMPTWNNFTLIPSSQFDSSQTKITSSFFLDQSLPQADSFKVAYHLKYGFNPTANSLKGYNLMLYFGKQLLKYQDKFMVTFPLSAFLGCNIKVVPVMKVPDVLYRENKSLFMLQHSNGNWRLGW